MTTACFACGLASYLLLGGPVAGKPVFEERFSSYLDERAWDAHWNGGGFPTRSGLRVLAAGQDTAIFPYLLTKPDMLPIEGDWNASVDFRVLSNYPNGNGFSLRNCQTGLSLFRVHADADQNSFQLWLGDAKYSPEPGSRWDGAPTVFQRERNGFTFRWQVEKRGKFMTLKLNGDELIKVRPDVGPYSIRLGVISNERFNSGNWSEVAYGGLRIEYVTAEPPRWLR